MVIAIIVLVVLTGAIVVGPLLPKRRDREWDDFHFGE